jgi:hypothetical protein
MLRRLYFVVPDESHAMQIMTDLEAIGVGREHVHAIPGKGVHLTQLPPATARQRHDAVWHLERVLWNANMGVFWIALAGLLAAVYFDSLAGALAAVAIMLAAFLGGAWFATHVPDVHLEEFRSTLAHGEILLMVDVPKRRVFEVEETVERRHPEAVAGGTGWTIGRLGI